ncbi:MAG TPA: IPT/TIG domain-containing protein, partial [Acidimicrobiales bacterium]|nr:IPT/TIG domain-containing protein [Acidimicrobiales bacterium]
MHEPAGTWRVRAPVARPRPVRGVAVAVALLAAALAALAGTTPAAAVSPGSVTATQAPVPAGGGAVGSINLVQVACPAAGSCVAVGTDMTATGNTVAVIEALASGSWSAVVPPVPATAATAGSGSEYVSLSWVSCISSASCVAVGSYKDSAGLTWPLIETLAAGSWTAATAPEPADAGTQSAGTESATLNGVTCPAAGTCVAVGSYYGTALPGTESLIDTLTSGTWSATAGPPPSGAILHYLQNVACPSTTSCEASGTYDAAGGVASMIDTLASGTWSVVTPPEPADASSPANFSLGAPSCPAVGSCVDVGEYENSSGWNVLLIETLSGGSWTATAGPVPAGAATGLSWFYGSACTAVGSCVAVGYYTDGSHKFTPVIDTLSGGTWSALQGPEPANAGTDAGGTANARLNAVACGAAGSCAAVGYYNDTNGKSWGLIETLSSGTWTATAATEPANAGTDGAGTQFAHQSFVACASSSACTSVGIYEDTNARDEGLIETYSGASWAATEAPQPASPSTDPYLVVKAVSCTSVSACHGAGTYADGSGRTWGLLQSEAGGVWSATSAPEPNGAGTDANGNEFASLSAINCPSAAVCVAVGSYEDSSYSTWGLIETLSAGTWTATKAPLPAGGGLQASLAAVTCTAVGSCIAVGTYQDSSYTTWGLIETLSSGTWTATKAPLPSGGVGSGNLDAVVCPAAGSCVAVGNYDDSTSHIWGLIDALSSGTWTATKAPLPTGGTGSTHLASVACPVTGTCVAVGSYADSSGFNWGLIDTLSSGTWTATQAPAPAGASNHQAQLASVSCTSATACAAVGFYTDSSGDSWGLLEALSGGSWSGTQAAEPTGAGTDAGGTQKAALVALNCASTAWCVATGTYEDSSGFAWGYLETGSSGSWTPVQVPEPSGAGTDGAGTQGAKLNAVSCAGDGSCLVAGSYVDSGITTEGLLDSVTPPAPTVTALSPTSGPAAGGTSVTVTGTWFFPGATTAFGMAMATTTYVSATSLSVTSPAGTGAVDVRVTTAGGTSAAVSVDQFTYPGGTLTLSASPTLYWAFGLSGYDQWASASASPLSGCTVAAGGTTCSGGSAPMAEVRDTTGSGSGWALSAYLSANNLPAGTVLDFDGAGSPTVGDSSAASVGAFPFTALAPGTVCDATSGCTPATPSGTCSHAPLGFTTCPTYPVNVAAGTNAATQVDLYSATAGSGTALVCLATGSATGAGCSGTSSTAF